MAENMRADSSFKRGPDFSIAPTRRQLEVFLKLEQMWLEKVLVGEIIATKEDIELSRKTIRKYETLLKHPLPPENLRLN